MRIVELRYEVQMMCSIRLFWSDGAMRRVQPEAFVRAVMSAPAFGSDEFGLFDDRDKAEAFAEYLGTSRTIINEVEVLPHNNGESA